MKIGNRAARKIIATYGYRFFCEFRRLRRVGYGIAASLRIAKGRHTVMLPSEGDSDACLGFDVVGICV